ncbi:MAG: dTDP-4-dehydrorhamnose 3,5-epimerase family protein [Candidatus Binatia bacterium]
MIAGAKTKALKVFADERGRVMEILTCDDDLFVQFGQLYMTTAYPGMVKAWRAHRIRVDNFAVVRGRIKLVLYDSRENSTTYGQVDEFYLGEENPLLVQVPAGVLHGFQCLGGDEAFVLNCTTMPYNPADRDLVALDPRSPEVPYDWQKMKP